MVKGVLISVLPAALFGCEIWGINHLYQVLFKGHNPYDCEHLKPIVGFLKKWVGLSVRASSGTVHRLLNLPSFVRLALPRLMKLLDLVSVS